ncbi:MAG: TRAP transporter small permease subunit [Burkholderiales bacterium]|nr:TRAP transporter small permease subunit [Burkholderiales bacterium]
MKPLLTLAHLIDRLNQRIGRAVSWLILATVLISAGNAIMRKAFQMSSNAFLEIQWTLFAAVFLLAAGYTLLKNEHVRIDILVSRLGPRAQAWIDVIGGLLFLLPLCALVLYHAWPFFLTSYTAQEWSNNPGGLMLWPAKLMIPLGFTLLLLQGLAEIIKRIGYLAGQEPPEPPAHSVAQEMLLTDTPEQKS